MLSSALEFPRRLPAPPEIRKRLKTPDRDLFLIYDVKLQRKHGAWIRRFPDRLAVRSGEPLKSLDSFSRIVEKILRRGQGRKLCFVAFGGGSIGDFAGFLASVYQRGSELVHFPSTWLAALDSAHGGKTALNVGGYKNQIGTFWPASTVWVTREVLLAQPPERLAEVLGEVVKTSLLRGDEWWSETTARAYSGERLWRYLPEAIRFKQKTVARDPYEAGGHRRILNLGHTMGHVIEARLGLPHGEAVRFGLCFAILWSAERGYVKEAFLKACTRAFWWPADRELVRVFRAVGNPGAALARDKKNTRQGVGFVFLRGPGRPIVEKVGVAEIVAELARELRYTL